MKKFYFKLESDLIVDVIEYPHEGYVEVELNETHLPAGINAGYYRLNNGVYTIDQDLKDASDLANTENDPHDQPEE